MESVNVEMDLRSFIRQARREVESDVAVAAQAAAAAANEAAATTAVSAPAAAASIPATGPASPPGAAAPAAAAAANEEGTGVVLANGAGGAVTAAAAAVGGAAGAGVLSTRADRRGAALAFERLFGVGPVRARRVLSFAPSACAGDALWAGFFVSPMPKVGGRLAREAEE